MRKLILFLITMLFYTVGYGSEFSIKGRIIDSETGKPIEGAYIGCAGLFEVKRDTPIYVSESEIVTVNALKQEWLKKKIENRYGKIPDDVKIDYIFRRTKDAAYGSPEGTQKIDVSTWEIEDIVDYTLNIKRSYRMFETGDKVFSWLIKLSGRAKTGKKFIGWRANNTRCSRWPSILLIPPSFIWARPKADF